ncbi:hypothetical protein Aros01_07241 [Streptosporangium roseum]|uniref:Uncharacterized protein n=2 Tax=Streptosporangium roseum TaxID=2001 RepID=D2B7B1_STRRD|nr:hypothetical protein Sros_6935 [Streptosporangium roseum DSM 43021]
MKIPILSPGSFNVTAMFSPAIVAGAVLCSAVIGGHSAPAAEGGPWGVESQFAAAGTPWGSASTDGTTWD